LAGYAAYWPLISRWLPLAAATREPPTRLVHWPLRIPAMAGHNRPDLAEELISGQYAAVAGQCFLLLSWLGEVRPAVRPHAETTARWQRIIDGLAAAGDSRAARLQTSRRMILCVANWSDAYTSARKGRRDVSRPVEGAVMPPDVRLAT